MLITKPVTIDGLREAIVRLGQLSGRRGAIGKAARAARVSTLGKGPIWSEGQDAETTEAKCRPPGAGEPGTSGEEGHGRPIVEARRNDPPGR